MTTQYEAYLNILNRHIQYVREAGQILGVYQHQLLQHDQSKFSSEEFVPYANYFYNTDGTIKSEVDRTPDEKHAFNYAWLRHIHHNKHHWQHWILREDSGAVFPLIMPVWYVREMLADWMGASKAYSDTFDIRPWLIQAAPRITLHPDSQDYLMGILKDCGYGDVVQKLNFR